MNVEKNVIESFNRAVVFAFLLLLVGFPVFAQTPDGEMPAVEGVCDPLTAEGVTKGLYGLCVAYCEAQDISTEGNPLTDDQIAALLEEQPSASILKNYNARKQESDPEMPCLTRVPDVACPCFTQEELETIDGYHDQTGEWIGVQCTVIEEYGELLASKERAVISEPAGWWPSLAGASRYVMPSGLTSTSCAYLDYERLDNGMTRITNRQIFGITDEEFEGCFEAIRDSIAIRCPGQ